jgi:hypothetical protein
MERPPLIAVGFRELGTQQEGCVRRRIRDVRRRRAWFLLNVGEQPGLTAAAARSNCDKHLESNPQNR